MLLLFHSFMHPLGEPELVLRVFRLHNLWHPGEDRSHWIFSVFITRLTLHYTAGSCHHCRKWNRSEALDLFLGKFIYWLVYSYDCLFISIFVYLSHVQHKNHVCLYYSFIRLFPNKFIYYLNIRERDAVRQGRKLQLEGTGYTLMQLL